MVNNQPLPELQRITIGRLEDNQVILTPTDIGRHHAIITVCGPNNYLIEDLNSKNGTFVNGDRIQSKLICEEDEIRFAAHTFLVKDILVKAKVIEEAKQKSDPDDFTEEFRKMEELYEQYLLFKAKEVEIQSSIKKFNDKVRLGGVLTGSTVGILALVVGGTFLTTLSSCGLTILLPALLSQFLGEDEKLNQPRLHFANNWKCPKCGDKTMLLGKSWQVLAKQKKCTRCNAVWMK